MEEEEHAEFAEEAAELGMLAAAAAIVQRNYLEAIFFFSKYVVL